ncbi:MAG TPA: PA domain-containing protein [Myxococcaceae bacterium]|nr:PA domain-containing protein [Myxococcaceae bacterium]
MKALGAVLGGTLLLVAAAAHGKANVVIVNGDPADAGFNDPTPVAPVGGNAGTTLGAQRLAVFQTAAEIWGNALDSTVPITVLSHFQPLACDSSGATLGSAGPTNIFASDDPTFDAGVPASVFPRQNTWYVSALSQKFAGKQVLSGTGTDEANYDIVARFNSSLDDPNASNCGGLRFYYGLDDQHGNLIDLLTVVLHEFGHGLGFISLTDPSSGTFPGTPPQPDIWAYYLYDESTGMHWVDLDDPGRQASAISGALAWDGTTVKTAVPATLLYPPVVRVTSAPASPSAVGDYPQLTIATFSGPIGLTPIAGPLGYGSTKWGCSGLGRLDSLDGQIAILDRGGPSADAGCTFVEKARNAQDAGAIGLLIANNTSNPPLITPALPSGDTGSDITIPVLLILQTDGQTLKAAVGAGTVNAEIVRDRDAGIAGADSEDRAFMYAPTTLTVGSSVSHWDTSAFPNLLMEPFINSDLTHSLDLTVPLLADIGWFSDGGSIVVPDGGSGTPDAGSGGGGGGGSSSGCTSAVGPPAASLALLTLLAFVRRRRAV